MIIGAGIDKAQLPKVPCSSLPGKPFRCFPWFCGSTRTKAVLSRYENVSAMQPLLFHSSQSPSGRHAAPPDMHKMGKPHHCNETAQYDQKVALIPAHIINEQRSALAEQVSGGGENDSPGKSTDQVEPAEPAGKKGGHTEDNGQNDPEAVGITGYERNERPVPLDELEGSSEFARNGWKA